MIANPFKSKFPYNRRLDHFLCQQIHFAAMQYAIRGLYPEALPPNLNLDSIRLSTNLGGKNCLLVSDTEIENIFCGITTAVFKSIENLYCNRTGRSIKTIHQIIRAMANEVKGKIPEYEAIWAVCLFLDERLKECITASTRQLDSNWELVILKPDIQLRSNDRQIHRPSILCILDEMGNKVLAFEVTQEQITAETINQVLYQALISQRLPSAEGVGGLVWSIPKALKTEIPAPSNLLNMCTENNITVLQLECKLPLVAKLRGNWYVDLPPGALSKNQFVSLFDNYLAKIHSYGPRRVAEDKEYEYKDLVGYNRNPSWQFPGLRQLLPLQEGLIDENSYIKIQGGNYTNALLSYFKGCRVTIRQWPDLKEFVWVYLEGEILGWATSLEDYSGYSPEGYL